MTAPAAIAGQLVDAKNVATHKSFRLVIDIPAERAMAAIEVFGWPTQANPVPVAIARMVEPTQHAAAPAPSVPDRSVQNGNGRRSWRDMSPAQQAALACKDPLFWKFAGVNSETGAANWVREQCMVKSRSELTTNHKARILWHDIDTRFFAWKHPQD